jgi:hypothetical protein
MSDDEKPVSEIKKEFAADCQQWAAYWNENVENQARRAIEIVMRDAPLTLSSWKSPLKSTKDDGDSEESPLDRERSKQKYGSKGKRLKALMGANAPEEADDDAEGESEEIDVNSKNAVKDANRGRFRLEEVLADFLWYSDMDRWLNEIPLKNKSAGRAFLTHKFFALVDSVSGKAAVIIESIALCASRYFSGEVAATIGLKGDISPLNELWLVIGQRLYDSLSTATNMLYPNGRVFGTFWWDPNPRVCPLVRLIQWEGLRRFSLEIKKIGFFISSPVGKWLVDLDIATRSVTVPDAKGKSKKEVIKAAVTKVECPRPDCGHKHTFLTDLGCSCEDCHRGERRLFRQPWLIAKEALESMDFSFAKMRVCVNGRCRNTNLILSGALCPHCHKKGKWDWVLMPSQSVSFNDTVKDEEGKQTSIAEVVRPEPGYSSSEEEEQEKEAEIAAVVRSFYNTQLSQYRKQAKESASEQRRQSAVYWLLALGYLTGESIADAVRERPVLSEGWEDVFRQNLTERASPKQAEKSDPKKKTPVWLKHIHESTKDVCDELDVKVTTPLTVSNFKTIKARLKDEWEAFVLRYVERGEHHA